LLGATDFGGFQPGFGPARKRHWLAAVGKNGLLTGVGAEQT
jgi:hypothetical protein